jgi:hypothetical protein
LAKYFLAASAQGAVIRIATNCQEVEIMRPRFKSVCCQVLWLLPLTLLLSFSPSVPEAWAQQDYDTYSGRVRFKGTQTEVNAKGKFFNKTYLNTGTVELYAAADGSGPVKSGEGYYLKVSIDNGARVGILGLELIWSRVPNSRTDSIKGLGLGELTIPDSDEKGLIYVDIAGSKVKDKYGNNKITLSMKISGGGITNPDTGNKVVFKASPKVTLTLAGLNVE